MKMFSLQLRTLFAGCLLAIGTATAGNFEAALKDAEAEIDKARAMNYEWRDSRKMLKEAQALYDKGDKKQAMALVEAAKKQGQTAVAQAKQQADVDGPHN